MALRSQKIIVCILLVSVVLTAGCMKSPPVRHLASEVCLIAPEKTTKPEVITYLGMPDEIQQVSESDEVWVYYQVQRSLLRKAPYLGNQLGHEEYDVVTVTFMGDRVVTCVYRVLSEEEFKARDGLPR